MIEMFTNTYGSAIQGNEQSNSVAERFEENSQSISTKEYEADHLKAVEKSDIDSVKEFLFNPNLN
jgi:hypothetical protein